MVFSVRKITLKYAIDLLLAFVAHLVERKTLNFVVVGLSPTVRINHYFAFFFTHIVPKLNKLL